MDNQTSWLLLCQRAIVMLGEPKQGGISTTTCAQWYWPKHPELSGGDQFYCCITFERMGEVKWKQ